MWDMCGIGGTASAGSRGSCRMIFCTGRRPSRLTQDRSRGTISIPVSLLLTRGRRICCWPFRNASFPNDRSRNWSDSSNMVAWGMARTGKDELSLYVTRHYRYTTAHLERCILRLDGFGSISASDIPGEVISRPLCFAGRVLHLNYATSAAGSVRVEIQTQDGLPAPNRGLKDCDELVGDKVDGIVRWHGEADLGFLAGAVVRLRFELCDADVYSLRFGT
jgi:hypothetical protein